MSRKFGQASRFVFTLTVDTVFLDNQLGCVPISKPGSTAPKNSTKINDLFSDSFTFLDPSKKTKKWIVTMANYISKVQLSQKTTERCFWCHHTFTNPPIGCPIEEVKGVVSETYFSYASKKDVEIKSFTGEKYYLTDGIFCGWGCEYAYAEKMKNDPIYRESLQLSHQMYHESSDLENPPPLKANPPFTILKDYGGPLSIEEFRGKYHIDTYKPTGNRYIRMVPTGELHEISSKF